MSESFSVKKMVSFMAPILNKGVEAATEVGTRAVGVLVDHFDDYSVPERPSVYEGMPRSQEEWTEATRVEPMRAEHHYRLARLHHRNCELTSAKLEYEAADLLQPLTGERRLHYLALLDALGLAGEAELQEIESMELDPSVRDLYPEYFL
ncbi:hypothetical protein [Paenibacillus sp.]|uniref:hypothetical protein n=1 Tax=Paenibacillus sp. TaxID=58172 RepID=UPI002D37841C|nr:hypothetical protein [Paenibacillus sp.]HZG85597.1 hypothetical protein [Paenibacillus sp.]